MSADDRVVCGLFEEAALALEPESFDLVVTSPPYGVGKDYEPDARFGETLRTLNLGFAQAARLLKRGGHAVFDFGDLIREWMERPDGAAAAAKREALAR